MVSRTQPSMTRPEAPCTWAALLMMPPHMPPASWNPSQVTMTKSRGESMVSAFCKIRLSPGRACTVKARPTAWVPGHTGRKSWVRAPFFFRHSLTEALSWTS